MYTCANTKRDLICMQVAGTAAGSGAGGGESVGEEDPAAATKKRGRQKKGQPPPLQTALPLVALLPKLSPKEVTKRRAEVPQKKRRKAKAKPGNGRWVGGGTVAKHAHTHFARKDGVSLCIAYRHGEATAMCSPEELIKFIARPCVLFNLKSMRTQKHMYATASCSCCLADNLHEFTLNLSHKKFSWDGHRRRHRQQEHVWQDVPEVKKVLNDEAVQVWVRAWFCISTWPSQVLHVWHVWPSCSYTIHTFRLNSFCKCFFLLIGRKVAFMFHLATVCPLMCTCLWTKQVEKWHTLGRLYLYTDSHV